MLTIKQLENFYTAFVDTAPLFITNNERITPLIKWLTYYMIKKDKINANDIYNKLIKDCMEEYYNTGFSINETEKNKEDILNKYDTTNTTNDTL